MRIAIVGSTGLVGTEMLKVVDERIPNVSEIIPVLPKSQLVKLSLSVEKMFPLSD